MEMIRKLFLSILSAFAVFYTANAQAVLPDVTMENDFKAQVKSLEEFQARFNGDEQKPGTDMGVDSLTRVNNLISLFDFKMSKGGLSQADFKQKLYSFVDSVIVTDTKFDMLSPQLFSECKCRFIYKGKTVNVTLVLQKEVLGKDKYRWAITGVKGLSEAGVIATNKVYSISPVEHEIYFIGLQDLFNENPSHAFGYKSKNTRVDQLSVLLALVQEKAIKFDIVEEQVYHYLGVPGFVFTIKEKSRKGGNSGWLIDTFTRATDKDKLNYITRIYEN